YDDGRPVRVDTVVISAQHREEVDIETLLRPDVEAEVIEPVLKEMDLDAEGLRILVNPTGRFEIGGPNADPRVAGREGMGGAAGASSSHPAPDRLSGPVDVCVAVPKLALDRPFTYLLDGEQDAGTGSLVSVPFHGRTVSGWVLGPAQDVPGGRLLRVKKLRSRVRFFDPDMLGLLRWASERYLAPLASVIERSHPPRVAGEE